MDDCGKGFAFCGNGCCADPSRHCCNVTCNRKGLLCYMRPPSSEEIQNELIAGLLGLVFMAVLYILFKTKFRVHNCDWIESACQCLSCDCKTCMNCHCFDKCLRSMNCIRRNRQNEGHVQEHDGDVAELATLEPASPFIQQADRDITSDRILDDSANENIETQSPNNITTGQSDRNTALAAASSSSDLPSYEEATKNDPPSYSVARLYPVTS